MSVAQIAQSVEQRTENPRVTGSIPVLGIQDKPIGKLVIALGSYVYLLYNVVPHRNESRTHINNARVVEWYYVSLPRRRSRVRFPSRALNFR